VYYLRSEDRSTEKSLKVHLHRLGVVVVVSSSDWNGGGKFVTRDELKDVEVVVA
jgi:hypothetical protein